MKLASYLCELCNQDKKKDEVLLVKYDFRQKPPRPGAVASEWYSGIRIVCKTCIKGLGRLLKDDCDSGESSVCSNLDQQARGRGTGD
jgi:hypothetical protein